MMQANPFAESQKRAKMFDDATLRQDVNKSNELVLSAEKDLDDNDVI